MVNASRQQAAKSGGAFAILNSEVARLIDIGYVHHQLSGLRRLNESARTRRSEQVISLKRLVDDVKSHVHLITREVFVCFDGRPFDYTEGRLAYLASGGGRRCDPETGPQAWGWSETQHECFDRLRGAPGDHGDRDEPLGSSEIERADAILKAAPFDRAKALLNKTIAHAADPTSRAGVDVDGIPFPDLWACQKALLQAATLVSGLIYASPPAGLPTPHYDVTEHWDAPFAPPASVEAIREEWDRQNAERAKWTAVD